MNKFIFSVVFFFATTLFVNAENGDDKPGSKPNSGRVAVSVYPNPTNNIVNVNFNEPLEQPIVETFNVNGQKVTPPSMSGDDGSNKMEVDLSGVAPGIYVLKIISAGEVVHVQKIIKQ